MKTLALTACWISSSVGTIQPLLRMAEQHCRARGFIEQDVQGGNARIPLYQRRDEPKTRECLIVERPDLGDDTAAMVVYAQRLAVVQVPNRVTCEVYFANCGRWESCDIGARIPAMV